MSHKALFFLLAACLLPAAYASAGKKKKKETVYTAPSNNQVLSRWAVDVNYRRGGLKQTISTIDFSKAYESSIADSTVYHTPAFSEGKSDAVDLHLGYFFNKSRTLGISIGAQYVQYTGYYSMDAFKADYKAYFKDNLSQPYRQTITAKNGVEENVTFTTLNVPVMLQFKSQFGKAAGKHGDGNFNKFGISGGMGFLLGVRNATTTNSVNARFDYEAVYGLKKNGETVAIDGFSSNIDPNNQLILKSWYIHQTNPGVNVSNYLDQQYSNSKGYNVGLDKQASLAATRKDDKYTELSMGGVAQLAVSYYVTQHITFQIGGYVAYQQWRNKGNESYHLSDKLSGTSDVTANYNGMTGGIQHSNYMAGGGTVGLRIFLGGKRDSDKDKIADHKDKCPYLFGQGVLGAACGCPDADGDGFRDDNGDDACPGKFGTSHGCPDEDNDGFRDDPEIDKCIGEAGPVFGCPVDKAIEMVTGQAASNQQPTIIQQPNGDTIPHLLLETDQLNFEFGKAVLLAESKAILDRVAMVLAANGTIVINIAGFTDDIGSEQNNLILSLKRAEAAKAYLVNKGTDGSRIILSGYGKENPVVPNSTNENRAKNRRIEMRLLVPVKR